MLTEDDVDDSLIEEAKRIGGHRTNEDAVTAALDEYIHRRKQLEILELFGTIDFSEDRLSDV